MLFYSVNLFQKSHDSNTNVRQFSLSELRSFEEIAPTMGQAFWRHWRHKTDKTCACPSPTSCDTSKPRGLYLPTQSLKKRKGVAELKLFFASSNGEKKKTY
jgi:hypothetical protein